MMRRTVQETFRQGFTIVEAVVVIAIIGIIAVSILTQSRSTQRRARDNKRIADVKSIIDAANMYADRTGSYPPCGCAFPAAPCCNVTSAAWGSLAGQLADFITLSQVRDPLWTTPGFTYRYQSDAANGCQMTFFAENCGAAGQNVTINCKQEPSTYPACIRR